MVLNRMEMCSATACAMLMVMALAAGCSEDQPAEGAGRSGAKERESLAGRWKGAIAERGKTIGVGLTLDTAGQDVTGKFEILDRTGGDMDKGHSVSLARGRREGNDLSFVVPLTGEIDDDALEANLRLEEGKLVGHMRERRDGSRELPVTFTRAGEPADDAGERE